MPATVCKLKCGAGAGGGAPGANKPTRPSSLANRPPPGAAGGKPGTKPGGERPWGGGGFCENSPKQLCRAKCPAPPKCKPGQKNLRSGTCCSVSCVAANKCPPKPKPGSRPPSGHSQSQAAAAKRAAAQQKKAAAAARKAARAKKRQQKLRAMAWAVSGTRAGGEPGRGGRADSWPRLRAM